MKIYVASKISNRNAALMLAYKLTKLGADVTSRWIEVEKETRPKERQGPKWEAFAKEWGTYDVEDVHSSDAVVILSVSGGMRGTWVEFGMALALNKRVHWIGGRDQTVFTWLDHTPDGTPITYHRDVEEFLVAIFGDLEEYRGALATEIQNLAIEELRKDPRVKLAIDQMTDDNDRKEIERLKRANPRAFRKGRK